MSTHTTTPPAAEAPAAEATDLGPADDEPAAPASQRSARRRRLTVGLAVVAVLATATVVAEVVALRPRAEAAAADVRDRAAVVRVAEGFAARVNTYDAASVDDYRDAVTPLLSPSFADDFDSAMTDLVSSVRQARMSSRGEVRSSAVESLDPDSASVLVVSDAAVRTVFDTRARHFRWQVSLVRFDGRWLVDDFTPVA